VSIAFDVVNFCPPREGRERVRGEVEEGGRKKREQKKEAWMVSEIYY
jgi:hypothetical protein